MSQTELSLSHDFDLPRYISAPNVEIGRWTYTPQVIATLNAIERMGSATFQDVRGLLNREGINTRVAHLMGQSEAAKMYINREGLEVDLIEQRSDGGLALGVIPYYVLPHVIGTEQDMGLINYSLGIRGSGQVIYSPDQRGNASLLPAGVIATTGSLSVTGIEVYNPIAHQLNMLHPQRRARPTPIRVYKQ